MTNEEVAKRIEGLKNRCERLARTVSYETWIKDAEAYEAALSAIRAFPAHIDREAWKCEFCERFNFSGARTEIDKYGARILISGGNTAFPTNITFKHCPECGRPLTPEAWEILEKRLRGVVE